MATRWWVVCGILLGLVATYWFAVGGFDFRRNAPHWLTATPVAHRGLHSGDTRVPENSLAAFTAAAEAGFAIELDVRMTADGELVVLHDENLERMTGDSRDVSSVTLGKLKRLRLLGGTESIPTLSEVFAVVGGRVPIFVEIKNRESPGALEDAVAREVSAQTGRAAVLSFNPLSLGRIAKSAPDVPRGQLTGTFQGESLSFPKKLVLSGMLMNWKSRPDFVVDELEALPSFAAWLQRRQRRPIVVWTATTHEEYERAEALGDNVIFELDARPAR